MLDLISDSVIRWLGGHAARFTWRTGRAWYELDEKMPLVNRSFNKVRDELEEVGLLADGVYLDEIELMVAVLPSFGEAGYVFDENVPWYLSLLGFEPGVIYLPSDVPSEAYVPGSTLTDVIRHEFAHAWHWLDPRFFKEKWFIETFGGRYIDDDCPRDRWADSIRSNRSTLNQFSACRGERERAALERRLFDREFVSEYAASQICEDFAETFMVYLRNRRSFSRFRFRPGVFRKLNALENAVNTTRARL